MLHSPVARTAEAQARARVAAAVMCGAPAGPLAGEPSAAEMKLARKNSVGLEFIGHYPAAAAWRDEESARLLAFRQTMQDTSALLAARGIPHIYIKFRKLYEYYDSNVDVLVAGRQWPAAVAALEAAGYTGHVMFKEPDKIMYSRPDSRVSVHLHPGVTWNGVAYFTESELWSHARPSAEGAWLEMSDEYDYLINLAHNIFENYEITLGDMVYFRRFLQKNSLNTGRMDAIAAANGWRLGFQQLQAQVMALVEAWDEACGGLGEGASGETGQTPGIPAALLAYPYRISAPVLARAFWERIARNAAGRRFRPALREAYAYPAFYALKRRHDLPFLSR